jgi:hypothetical protein
LGRLAGIIPPGAAKRLGIEVNCPQEHWAGQQGPKLPSHGSEERKWWDLDAFQFQVEIHRRIPRGRYPNAEADETDDENGPPGGSQRRREIQRAYRLSSRFLGVTLQPVHRAFERCAIDVMQACKPLIDATRQHAIRRDEAQWIMDRVVRGA